VGIFSSTNSPCSYCEDEEQFVKLCVLLAILSNIQFASDGDKHRNDANFLVVIRTRLSFIGLLKNHAWDKEFLT